MKLEKPLISILTPFKNTEAYLEECLQSIQCQSYKNWELLIVDDHSTDRSNQIVQEYATRDKRIKLFKNKGAGIIPALRTAFKNSSGGYVTRMDSDDIMIPDKLEIMLNSLLDHGEGHVAVGQVEYFSDEGISEGYAKYEAWLNQLTQTGDNYSEIYKECVIPSPCWMVSRQDFLKSGAFEPNRYPEDYDLTFRFYENNLKCIPCSTVIHQWRDYSTRTSRTHEHYAQNYFLDIKLHYFLKLHHDPNRPLTIWGAGFKGKTIANALKNANIPFHWICDNPNKINKKIYDVPMEPFENLQYLENPQCVITVANEEAQVEIRNYLLQWKLKNMVDYFFFC